jgi:lipopolysaccharide transport system ATP-binding protein
MADIAITVQGLGKRFHVSATREKYYTFRDILAHRLKSIFRDGRRDTSKKDETIWALKNLSFEVRHGEVVGIIGRNGAGKSTLLKILSRITEPTTGFAEISGRVGSLLEVGTGFHPELTGRENIFLNGAILGMKKAEISRKFDEIVDFAEVSRFIDTPVKHYSSGMYLRLAFAVAAHLEPDILIVDEVLAVGDARFQKKCLDKMQDVGAHGRTVLFVSHNMQAITRLCPRAILLDNGSILEDGPSHKVVRNYLNSGFGTTAYREWPDPAKAPAGEIVRLRSVRVRAEDGSTTDVVDIRRPLWIEMEYQVLESGRVLMPYFDVHNEEGVHVFSTLDVGPEWGQQSRPAGMWVSMVHIPGNLLAEGTHFVTAGIFARNPDVHQFNVREAVTFQVFDSLDGDSARGDWAGEIYGVVRPLLKWTTQPSPAVGNLVDHDSHGEKRTGKPVPASSLEAKETFRLFS